MKILFLTDNFPPEVNAPASRTYDHCREWLRQGVEVTVITCAPNYPRGKVFNGYKNSLYSVTWMDGIKVIRVWTYMAENKGAFKRVMDYLSFAFMSFWAGLFLKTDMIVATSPQFFTAVSGYILHLFKRKPWIFEVRDLWPESIVAVEAMGRHLRVIHWLEKLELFLYRKASKIVVVTDSFKKNMIQRGIKPEKVYVVKNGVRFEAFHPMPKNQTILGQLGLQDKFIITYIGTHGMAHKLDFIIESAQHITDKKIHILLIGDGAEKDHLVALTKKLGLTNVSLHPSVPKSEIGKFISISDIALVNLKKSDTFKTVIPSKIFENAAMEKPILLGVEGEAQGIIEDYKAGLCFEPENQADFINKIMTLATDKKCYENCQEGCRQLAYDFNRDVLARKMLAILKGSETFYTEAKHVLQETH